MRIPPNLRDMFPFPVETIKQLSQLVGQPQLVNALKEAAEKVGIKEPFGPGGVQQIFQQAGRWVDAVAGGFAGRPSGHAEAAGVNATGELFSPRWCSPPWASMQSQLLVDVLSSYASADTSIAQLKNQIQKLTGATEFMVLSNTTTALHALGAADRGSLWIVPRVDCIKMPRFGVSGASSVRDTLDASGVRVKEVGSNQECDRDDIASALEPSPTTLLVASPNSLASEDRDRHLKVATEIAAESNVCFVRLLMNAQFHKFNLAGLETTLISQAWSSANDILVVPCDQLLGGMEACLVLTQRKLPVWQSLQRITNLNGFEASSLHQAALSRLLRVYDSEDGWENTGVGQCLTTSSDNLRNRAERLATQLAGTRRVERTEVISRPCRIGSGVWNQEKLDSSVVRLYPRASSIASLVEYLEGLERPIWANSHPDHVELVVRTMDPDEDRYVAQCVGDESIEPDAGTENNS